MNRFGVIFDFETSGLTLHPDADIRLQPQAIEIGAALISLQTGKIVKKYQTFIKPRSEVSAEITKITGITNEMLADQRSFIECLPEIAEFFTKGDAMCSHNLPFDRAILQAELVRASVVDFPWPAKEFCTVGLYHERYGFNPKLSRLYEDVIGKPLAQTHRAMDDVDALVEIVQKETLWRLM